MTAVRRSHGGAAVRNGRLLVLVRGGPGGLEGSRPMIRDHAPAHRPHPRIRELASFIAAVFIGSVGGLISGRLLLPSVGPAAAGNVALAVGTTLTGATHARLIHGQSLPSLVPRILVAAPLAYGVMLGVHRLLVP